MYGQPKPLALRTPLSVPSGDRKDSIHRRFASDASGPDMSTPPFTEGETATETEVETEMEDNLPARGTNMRRAHSKASAKPRSLPKTQHDLLNQYFRKDVIGIHNIDLLR
jgi:phosphatidylethanolamine N-methyltransferase